MTSVTLQDSYPCSPQQSKEYIRFKILGDQTFNHNIAFEFKDLDLAALEATLSGITSRHESLRTTFFLDGGHVRQRVHRGFINEICFHDLRGRSMDELRSFYNRIT